MGEGLGLEGEMGLEMDGEEGISSHGESTSISGDSVSLSWMDGVLVSLPLLLETRLSIFVLVCSNHFYIISYWQF